MAPVKFNSRKIFSLTPLHSICVTNVIFIDQRRFSCLRLTDKLGINSDHFLAMSSEPVPAKNDSAYILPTLEGFRNKLDLTTRNKLLIWA